MVDSGGQDGSGRWIEIECPYCRPSERPYCRPAFASATFAAPDTKHGLYDKFQVRRNDGSSGPGGKHEHCRYYVLDLDHDRFAPWAINAYALACETEYPELAKDLKMYVAGKTFGADGNVIRSYDLASLCPAPTSTPVVKESLTAAAYAPMDTDLERVRGIAQNLRNQDNRITQDPIFVVQQKQRIWGPDQGDYAWMDEEWTEVDAAKAAELDAAEETGESTKGYTKAYYVDIWVFVTACFTEQGCKDYLLVNGHNLREPRIYAESGWRNAEWIFLRKFLTAQPGPASTGPAARPMKLWAEWDSVNLKVWSNHPETGRPYLYLHYDMVRKDVPEEIAFRINSFEALGSASPRSPEIPDNCPGEGEGET